MDTLTLKFCLSLVIMFLSYILGLYLLLQDDWIGVGFCSAIIAGCVYIMLSVLKTIEAERKKQD